MCLTLNIYYRFTIIEIYQNVTKQIKTKQIKIKIKFFKPNRSNIYIYIQCENLKAMSLKLCEFHTDSFIKLV